MRPFPVRVAFVLGVLVVASSIASAQNPIGTVHEAYGFVEIDAFGTGRFLEVVVPEAVYEASVIRTDYESWAYLSLDGAERTVGPNSTTPVSSFLNTRRRSRGDGFLSRVVRELTRSLLPPEEDEIVAGGRAAQVQGTTTDWVFEVDPDELFEQALHQIDAGRYESAVESLRLIEFPEDGEFEIEEYYVNLSYALMGMGDFHAGMAASFEYALADPVPENVASLTPRLKLLGGIAAYYAGDDAVSSAALGAYLEDVPMEDAATEAVVLRYLMLYESGSRAAANELLRRAERARPEVDWSALINR